MVVGPPEAPTGAGRNSCTRLTAIGHTTAVHPSVEAALPQIRDLCRRLGVVRLDLFGSASGSTWSRSPNDVDVLVEFGPLAPGERFDAYFILKEGLERLLSKPVDVVAVSALENPYFLARVLAERESLYAA
jgi:predicted nucleotidyltransferase